VLILPEIRPNGGEPASGVLAATWFVRFFRDPVGFMREVYRAHGPVSAVGDIFPRRRGPPRLHAFAFGPRFNEQVLGHPDRFRTTGQTLRGPPDSAQRRIRFGLTRMTGEKHRQQRQLVLPALQRKAVESYYPQMTAITGEVLDGWREGERFDLWRAMRGLSLQVSSRILFGFAEPGRAVRLAKMIERWGLLNFSRGVWVFPLDLPGTPYRALLRHAERLEREILATVAEKRAQATPTPDALSALIHARDDEAGAMTDTDLVGQITILFGASYETMVNALTWTAFLLAQHPGVTHELLDELAGAGDGFDELARLPLLDAVIKESMRVLPPVPYTVRAAIRRNELGHLRLRDGDRVVCSHYITHHMPELYPHPERFDPHRWATISPTQYEYLPFSAGPRLCVGYLFAMTAMKVAFAHLLRRWRIAVEPHTRIDRAVRVTMTPARDLWVTAHRADRRWAAAPVRGNIHEMVDLITSR